MNVLTAKSMRLLEEAAVEDGLDYLRLMENAGSAAAEGNPGGGPVRAGEQWRRRICDRPQAAGSGFFRDGGEGLRGASYRPGG